MQPQKPPNVLRFPASAGVAAALVLGAVSGPGCEVRRASSIDAGPRDAPVFDTNAPDARASDAPSADVTAPDAFWAPDALFDAPPIDTGPSDTGPSDAGPRDTGPSDAGPSDAGPSDAGPSDAGPADTGVLDAGAAGTRLECAVPVPAGPSSGILLSSNIWSGFRFEIIGGARIVGLGLQLTPEPGPGTVFGALVRLSGPSDTPDDPALGGSDVIDVRSIAVPSSTGAPVIVGSALDLVATPGWYAVVFGTGAFGATLAGGNIPSGGGGGCRALPGSGYPFSIRQSDGMFILQGAEPHMFVELAP